MDLYSLLSVLLFVYPLLGVEAARGMINLKLFIA